MGEELDKPEKNYEPIDKENKYVKFGLNQVQGWKKTMEDFAMEFLDPDDKKFMNIFGIFDGHGGREVPKYLSSHFLKFLQKNPNFNIEKYKEAFTETFFEIDKSFTTKEVQEELTKYSEEYKPDKEKELKEINDLCAPNEKLNKEELEQVMAFNEVFDPRNIENANIAEFTGATGMIIAICYRNILVANAGNSRCLILNKEGKILNSTKDHTIKDENEKKRVDLARSFNDEEEEKQKGEDEHIEYLDSTRGFGDLEFKGNEWIEQKDQEISVEPDILLVPYDEAKYIIIGSHGMFEGEYEKVNDEVGKFFIDEINKNSGSKFSDIIKNYFEKIISKEKSNKNNIGLDNMSCFLVELNNEEIKKYIEMRDKQIQEEKKKEEERKKKLKEEEMKRKAEEKKKREEERKRKEEEKKKKEEEEKRKKEGGDIQQQSEIIQAKEENKIEETKGEPKQEIKQDKIEEKKEEQKEEKKEEQKEEKKEEQKEEKKEEPKEEKKEENTEGKNEIVIEEKKEEPKEEKKEENIEEKNEIVIEENKEEPKEENIEEEKKNKEDKKEDTENKEKLENKIEVIEENKIEDEKKEEKEEEKPKENE